MTRTRTTLARLLAFVAGAAAAALGASTACSNAPAPASSTADGGVEAGLGPNQSTGAPCDPTLTNACLPNANPCATVTCDPVSKTCVETVATSPACRGAGGGDASSDASALVSAPCTSASDCDAGEVCGFLPLEGCSATGACVTPSPPDAGPACSCDGVNVSYVTATLTSAPVISASPCADAGLEGAADASDASDDAG